MEGASELSGALCVMLICLIILCFWLHQQLKPKNQFKRPHTKLATNTFTYTNPHCRNVKKPPWVTEKVLYIKAITGFGCGKVAETFNRLHGDKETVSKSFVYDKLKKNTHRLHLIKRQIKAKPPRPVAVNHTWGIDLTTVSLSGKQKAILGIIDHGSRLCLKLEALPSSSAFQIILALTSTIRHCGFPKYIRTDNGRCFTAKSTKLVLRLLGIKHHRTNIASPWQNGRIERFFGTFKPLAKLAGLSEQNLPSRLAIFVAWYNCVRTHESLNGRTPKEAWIGKLDKKAKQPILVSGWDGLLTGYYLPD